MGAGAATARGGKVRRMSTRNKLKYQTDLIDHQQVSSVSFAVFVEI